MENNLIWPRESIESFEEAVTRCIEQNLTLIIREDVTIRLDSTILLKENSKTLSIVGSSDSHRPVIVSTAHSMFQVGGRKPDLILRNLVLRHECARSDHRDIGGVIFALNLARVNIVNCDLCSTHGFGVWAVQRASVSLSHCSIESERRSGCVVFGRANLSMTDCIARACNIHNVCTRGNTSVNLIRCRLTDAKIRALYAYHSPHVCLQDCDISGTRSSQHAAIDIWSSVPRVSANIRQMHSLDSAVPRAPRENTCYNNGQGKKMHVDRGLRLELIRCRIHDNAGSGLRIRDELRCPAHCDLVDCCIENNAGGDELRETLDGDNDGVFAGDDEEAEEVAAEEVITAAKDAEDRISVDAAGAIDGSSIRTEGACEAGLMSSQVQWEFEEDAGSGSAVVGGADEREGHWRRFDEACNNCIEEYYQRLLSTRSEQWTEGIETLTLPEPWQHYEINLMTMQQTNTRTFFMRLIRRNVKL